MQTDWLILQRWGAIVAVALFVLSTTPHDHDHDHDGTECENGTCVPCLAQQLQVIDTIDRSGDPEKLDVSVGRIPCADTLDHPRNAEVYGEDSRAPPA